MTINKSQGQSFRRIGVYLKDPVFSHGQAYVAFSRVRSFDGFRVWLPEQKTSTKNIVYQEVLS